MYEGRSLAQFTVKEQIGTGGMGAVWRARDTRLNRDVALKILPEAFADDSERMARFQREAQALAALQHPNIASIYGIEQVDGVAFLVMELCEGEDLSSLVGRGPIGIIEARDIAAQIARGLEEAHEKGIIHRDLKPANVKVSPEGRVKILDFGLARTLDEDQPETDISGETLTAAVSMTRPGVVLGTAAYMSPEQARGKTVDKRTDIWAFGVILYEMITGQRLFEGETVSDVLASVLRQDPDFDALPADLPLEMVWLLRRCLDRNRESRLRDIGEARCLVSDGASASSISLLAQSAPTESGLTTANRRRWAWPAVAGIALAALLIQFLAGSPPQGEDDPLAFTGFSQLTPLSTGASLGNMAPGGLFFVYTDQSDGNADIFLQRGGGLNPINLTADSPALDAQPAVSPDGQQIVFTSHREGRGLFIMGTTGESARLLAATGARPAWSPDGSEIVYSTEDFRVPWAREGFSRLRIIRASGGEYRELDLEVEAIQPDWSPDGKRIAFWGVVQETAQRDLWSVRPDGSGLVRLTDDADLDWCPKWSPDGRWLYFLSNRSGMNNLWRLPVDSATGLAAGAPEMVNLPSPDVRHFAFAPEGRGIVYSAVSQSRSLLRMPFDPVARTTTGPAETVMTGNLVIHSFDLSPTGSAVAFVISGVREDLFVIGSDGTGLRQLTNDGYRDRGPSWIDGGRRLLFYSDRSGKYDIWSIRADGADLRSLTNLETSLWYPVDVPGAGFVTGHEDEGTFRMEWNENRTALGPPVPLIEGLAPDRKFWGYSWSPDGTRLAGWLSDNINNLDPEYCYFDRRDGILHPIDLPGARWPVMKWLPDNHTLLIRSRSEILAYDTVTGGHHVALPADALPSLQGFDISADGTLLILDSGEWMSALWLAEMDSPRP
jgi:serine/threonine protein kinase/Tol biopolymer transport system component